MWVLKFKSKEEWNVYNKRTLNFNVKIYFYSRNYYIKGKKIYFIGSGIIFGDEENKKSFFEDLKKDKQKKLKLTEIFLFQFILKIKQARELML